MTPTELKRFDKKLNEFLSYMTEGMGRPERRRALEWYLTGLLLDGGRKSVVGMAGRLVDDESEIEAMRQRLQQCVTVSSWADEEVRRRLALRFEQDLQPEAFIVDDTGFPKKGEYSVGVHRQYSGTMGRVDNCQVATSLHVANDDASGCIGMRLYLPESWASDIVRRRQAGVPEDIVFEKKWQLGLRLLDEALAWGLTERVVIADAGFGDSTEFRDGLEERGLPFIVGVVGNRLSWPPGSNPRVPKKTGAHGRPRTRHADGRRKPCALEELFDGASFRKYSCPDGRGGLKSGHFAFMRVKLAERHTKGRPPSNEMWAICEKRSAKKEYRYYLSSLPADTSRRELVRLIKLRWRVERDYQEMKSEVGLDHFEGRTWRGFHHHVTLCAVAHGFLALQRRLFPPEDIPLDDGHGPKTYAAAPTSTTRHVSSV